MFKNMIVLAALLGVGCKADDDRPPPVKSGACVVDRYDEARAVRQHRRYQGYFWDCISDTCERQGEVPDERPAMTGVKK